MNAADYQRMLHARCSNNRGALLDSRQCGCFDYLLEDSLLLTMKEYWF